MLFTFRKIDIITMTLVDQTGFLGVCWCGAACMASTQVGSAVRSHRPFRVSSDFHVFCSRKTPVQSYWREGRSVRCRCLEQFKRATPNNPNQAGSNEAGRWINCRKFSPSFNVWYRSMVTSSEQVTLNKPGYQKVNDLSLRWADSVQFDNGWTRGPHR